MKSAILAAALLLAVVPQQAASAQTPDPKRTPPGEPVRPPGTAQPQPDTADTCSPQPKCRAFYFKFTPGHSSDPVPLNNVTPPNGPAEPARTPNG